MVPSPLSTDELASSAASLSERVASDQEPITGKIDLYDALARALKYNLDYHVEVVQTALRTAELDLSHYNKLPSVVANSGYAARNEWNASSSLGIPSMVPTLSNSTSQEKHLRTSDVAFSWSIIDFGLSYVRARQAADKVLIAEEVKRRAVHRIVEDVRTAYFRAVSYERLVEKLRHLESRTKQALQDTRTLYETRQASPITALTYERELVEIKRTIQELERDLKVAKSQLAALMNVKPGTQFTLAVPKRRHDAPTLGLGAKEMIQVALRNRSELREVAYQRRINEHEADAALLEILPGFQLYAGSNYDSNHFLMNNYWANWGAKAGWNLVKVFQYPAKREVVELQDKVLDQRALALTMAIMTQVHVSRVRYLHLRKELLTAAEYLDVQRRLVEQIRAEASADRVSEQTVIREEMNTLVAEVKHDIAYAALQNSFANLYASMGLDPYADGFADSTSVKQLAAHLRQLWFERGDHRSKVKVALAAE